MKSVLLFIPFLFVAISHTLAVEIALLSAPPKSPDLDGEPHLKTRYVLFAPVDYPWARKGKLPYLTLARLRLLFADGKAARAPRSGSLGAFNIKGFGSILPCAAIRPIGKES